MVERLRIAFLMSRRKAEQLVSLIRGDLPDLTVHDIHHIDMLWHTADLIAGPHYPVNPLESFVFGTALLIHDAALSVPVFEASEQLKPKFTYAFEEMRVHFNRLRALGVPPYSVVTDETLERLVKMNVLRSMHTFGAQGLATQQWATADRGTHLIEDEDLRIHYGQAIGRIAASHGWDHEDLTSLGNPLGSLPGFPHEWTVDPIKLACLLRVADAAHISTDRAPLLLQALLNIGQYSNVHWQAQSKMLQPVHDQDQIRFTTGTPFTYDEANAWWFLFDYLRMIDKELRCTDALLSLRRVAVHRCCVFSTKDIA